MNDHRETKDARQNMEEGHSSAIDFVMNAWSLLRGAADKEGSQSSEDGEHTENRVSTIAAASLAAAGGNSQEKDIDFVKQSWALYQQAMEEGWVSDWIESFTAPNVRLCDAVASPTLSTSGHADLTHYYNALLDKIWGNGPASLTWKPRSFRSAGKNTGVVIAEYDIEVTPKSLHHSRQLWIYHVVDEKIAEMYVLFFSLFVFFFVFFPLLWFILLSPSCHSAQHSQMFPGASPSGHPRAMPPADETPAYATQQTRASPQPSDTEVNLDECLVSSTNLPTSHFTAPATTAVNNSILQPHHHHQQQPQQVPQQQPQQVQVPQQQVQQQQQQVQQQQMPHQMMQQSQQQPQQTQQPFAAFQQAQHQLLEATPAHHLATTTSTPCLETASVPESMPSLATSLSTCYPMPSSVGVSLTRPCAHNSWDNVRIKRGWAILRCRICQVCCRTVRENTQARGRKNDTRAHTHITTTTTPLETTVAMAPAPDPDPALPRLRSRRRMLPEGCRLLAPARSPHARGMSASTHPPHTNPTPSTAIVGGQEGCLAEAGRDGRRAAAAAAGRAAAAAAGCAAAAAAAADPGPGAGPGAGAGAVVPADAAGPLPRAACPRHGQQPAPLRPLPPEAAPADAAAAGAAAREPAAADAQPLRAVLAVHRVLKSATKFELLRTVASTATLSVTPRRLLKGG